MARIPSPQVVAPVPPAALEIMRLAGDRPDFKTRPIQTFADPDNSEVWYYWYDAGADRLQISKCNFKTKRRTNVTKRFSFVKFPWSPVSAETKVPLPVNLSGAVTGGKLEGHRVFLIFGGEVDLVNDSKDTTPRLTIFDLDTFKWWHADLSTDVLPRLDPCMTFINNSLYIFGGEEHGNKDSYSIATFNTKTHRWHWAVRDKPYPPGTPSVGWNGAVVPIHGGKQILLTPGCTINEDDAIDLTPDQLLVFDTVLRTFETPQTMNGEFPEGTFGYSVNAVPQAPPSTSDDSPSTDAVLIATWKTEGFWAEDGRTLPDLWLLTFAPGTPQCRRLDVHLADLGMSLSVCTLVSNGCVHLLGSHAPLDEEKTLNACLIVSGLLD